MRIIAGQHRGRRLLAPAGQATRPTADRVRQALFDMLWHAPWAGRERIEGARVLDAFAGTGALGLEALSRGAASAIFLENDRAALAALRTNIATCREEARCRVLPADATKPPAPEDQLRADLLSALLNLGYQRVPAEKAIDKVLKDAPEARFDEALRAVLRALMK